jgi:MFS family permease
MRELFRIRDFRLLFAGLLASMVGDLLLTLMLAVWVAKLTGSDSAAGITLGCEVIAYAVSPLIAWPADRFRRRPLMIAANLGTAAILIPLLTVHHQGRIWVIYAVAVAYGAASVISAAASQAMIGLIVPTASTPDAYGVLQTARQSLRVGVPVAGIALYTRTGPSVVVIITVVSLVASAVAIAAIRVPEARPERSRRRWLAEMTAGARQLAGDRIMSRITVGNSCAMLAAGAFAVLGFAVVTDGLGKPAGFLSVLVSVQAGTAIFAAMLSARIVRRLGEIGATTVCFVLAGASMFLTVFPSLAVVITAYALAGFALPLGGVAAYSAAQRRIPAHVFARTMVTYTSAVALPQAIGIPVAAAVLTIVGFRQLILICFAIIMLMSAYMWRGRALTWPSRETTPTDLSAATDNAAHLAQPAVPPPPAPAPRRPPGRLDISHVLVGNGTVQSSVDDIRMFDDRVEAIARAAARAGTPIRIGVGAGWLDKHLLAKYSQATTEALVQSALFESALFESALFGSALFGSAPGECSRCNYPLHLGMTEAGPAFKRTVNPAVTFGVLLAEGIGDTIRAPVSAPLSTPSAGEIKAGIAALKPLGPPERGLEMVSCPSCGRAQVHGYTLAGQVTAALDGFTAPLRVGFGDVLSVPRLDGGLAGA